jgi:hypothetical protein
MQAFDFSQLIPPYPLHWTTILHYLILLVTIFLLTASGDKTPTVFIFVLAVLALADGADLYAGLIHLAQIFIFLIRVILFGVPVVIAGMAPTEQSRSMGVLLAILGAPLLALTFVSCMLGPIGDPRILGWCH